MKKIAVDFKNTRIAFKHMSDQDLMKAWALFKAISLKPLVLAGPPLIQLSLKLHLPIRSILRQTIFGHFCGGETLEDCVSTVERLKKNRVASILDYGVEGEKSETGFTAATDEVVRVIAATSGNNSVPFCVFKLTAIARFELLELVSNTKPGKLKPQLQAEWAAVKERVERICDDAISANKLVMIDAEETWIQPAIDQLAIAMMQKHNKKSARIYTTVQMYRTEGLKLVNELILLGKKDSWHPGIKLVRGAYMEKERTRAKQHGYTSPIHHSKADTDKAYDDALEVILREDSGAFLCAGTHNLESTLKVTELMQQQNIPINSERVWFAQLYGMSDDLTFNAADAGYNAAKYIPYGPIAAVLPYLFRRAEENTSIAGQSGRELKLIESELQRRKKK